MILIYGGVYQGKHEYAKERYGLDSSCFTGISKENINLDCIKAIDDINSFVRLCVREGKEAKEELEARRSLWQDSILIMDDVSSGLVPMNAEDRAYREMCGRLTCFLAREADEVYRVFCGLPQRLK